MHSLVEFFSTNQVVLFMLLFTRLSGLFAFFPFFSHLRIPMTVKTAMAFCMTMFLFPLATLPDIEYTVISLTLALVSELMLGFIAGLFLVIVFGMLQIAGMNISFVMGFTMANLIDPQTGVGTPIVSTFFTLLALVILLSFNGHHLMILFIAESLNHIPLGGFYPTYGIWEYLVVAVASMFMFGFILSFPVIGISLLADIVFGMLMKTMPSFNLLVVGFPIKIMISFIVMIVTLGSIMIVFKREMLEALNRLSILFI